MSGVYQIFNQYTNKRYIGSSINIERRLKEHRYGLKTNRHHNIHLQNAWNKYQEFLVFEPLEYCNADNILKLEQEWIDYYKAYDRQFGYNIDRYADHTNNHLSEESIEKIRQKATGRKWSDEMRTNWTISNTGIKKPKQSKTMSKLFKSGHSTFPRFSEVSKEEQKIWSEHLSNGQNKRFSNYENRPEGYYLKVIFSDDIKFYPSFREASRQLNVNKSAIRYVIENTNGFMKKLNCSFIKINKSEFLKNKVAGQTKAQK